MSPDGLRLLFVGPGRLGLSLGYALAHADAVSYLAYAGRRPEAPAHPLFIQGTARYGYGLARPEPGTDAVLLSVPDEAIHEVAQRLAALGTAPPGCSAFHFAGALSTDVLAPLHERGYSVGSLHPLQAVANGVSGADVLPGSFFAVSGEPLARATAQRLLSPLGSRALEVPATRRPLYDAAAVMASDYVTLLLETAGDMLARAGVAWDEGVPALRAIVLGVLSRLGAAEGTRWATGPLSRGDVETVRLHLRSMEPAERALYAVLGLRALEWGASDASNAEMVRELRDLLERER